MALWSGPFFDRVVGRLFICIYCAAFAIGKNIPWWEQSDRLSSNSLPADINCTGLANVTGLTKRCTPALCIEAWVELMPAEWLDTTRVASKGLQAPLWSPLDRIVCTAALSVDNIEGRCTCELPQQTPRSMLQDTANMRALLFGDSTIRNYYTFHEKLLMRNMYASFSGDNNYALALNVLMKESAQDSMRGNSLSSYVRAHSSFQERLTSLPMRTVRWTEPTGNDNPCLNLSARNANIIWNKESYEMLHHKSLDYRLIAADACANTPPDRGVVFLLTAGLHYLPV